VKLNRKTEKEKETKKETKTEKEKLLHPRSKRFLESLKTGPFSEI
jgi:hypothetical protein